MGKSGRDFLKELYKETDRKSFEIVVYWPVSSLENLEKTVENYQTDYLQVSDFLQDQSLMKITYGAQAMPTCFLIDKNGKVVFVNKGLPEKELTKLKQENKL